MNVFQEVKAQIGADTVIRDYGIKIGRNGMACCPFHPDKNPSMKVDEKHYHCFGCGAHGDIVNFVAKYCGLSQYEAAKKIISDYNLPIDAEYTANADERGAIEKKQQVRVHVQTIKDRFKKWAYGKVRELKECEDIIYKTGKDLRENAPGEILLSGDYAYMLQKEPI
ncbi:MAG: hypothetical protein K6G84_11765, partial [Lachnospiraceae bacterium]|nr:hypothetical protein [Lachnospiraceae bacterium]